MRVSPESSYLKNSCTFGSTLESFTVVALLIFQGTTSTILLGRSGLAVDGSIGATVLLLLCAALLLATLLFYVVKYPKSPIVLTLDRCTQDQHNHTDH